jgi:hypothetical protein
MKDYPVKVGSMLFTIVDPQQGHEVEYNRWYERDHFYAGCMVGPWLFAGSRWVSTKTLKRLRYPEDSTLAKPTVQAGSYLAFYWIHADHHEEHHAWASQQARWLYQNDRGFNQRTHVHTLMYTLDWVQHRDADPVPLELSPDHRFAGLVTVAIERREGVEQARLDEWWQKQCLPAFLAGSPIASCSTWSPIPQGEGPMPIPRVERTHLLDLQLYFTDGPAAESWPKFIELGKALEATGLGRVVFASPWLPTSPGTDKYTDQLW